MTALTPVAEDVDRDIVGALMEAQARNAEQAALIANPGTDEIDSLVEIAAALTPGAEIPRELHRATCDLLARLTTSNAWERQHERTATSAGERLFVGLRRFDLNGALSAKSLARQLRPPLRDVAEDLAATGARDLTTAARLARAYETLATIARRYPRWHLTNRSLAHELGPGRFALWLAILNRGETCAELGEPGLPPAEPSEPQRAPAATTPRAAGDSFHNDDDGRSDPPAAATTHGARREPETA